MQKRKEVLDFVLKLLRSRRAIIKRRDDSMIMDAYLQELEEGEKEQVVLKEKYHPLVEGSGRLSDGDLEMDDDAVVSKGEDAGAYVQVWLWVEDPQEVEVECQV